MKITHSASRHAVSHHPVVYCFVSIQQQVLSCYSLRHHSLLKAKWFECEYDVIAYAARILLKIPAPLNIKRLPASLVECNTVPKSLMKHLISAWSLPENTELWDASNIKSRLNNYSWSFLFCVQMCFLTSFFAQTHQSYCFFFFFFFFGRTLKADRSNLCTLWTGFTMVIYKSGLTMQSKAFCTEMIVRINRLVLIVYCPGVSCLCDYSCPNFVPVCWWCSVCICHVWALVKIWSDRACEITRVSFSRICGMFSGYVELICIKCHGRG